MTINLRNKNPEVEKILRNPLNHNTTHNQASPSATQHPPINHAILTSIRKKKRRLLNKIAINKYIVRTLSVLKTTIWYIRENRSTYNCWTQHAAFHVCHIYISFSFLKKSNLMFSKEYTANIVVLYIFNSQRTLHFVETFKCDF